MTAGTDGSKETGEHPDSPDESRPLISGQQGDTMEHNQHQTKMDLRRICVVLSILLTEMCERMTFYGVTGNLVLFCTSILELTSLEAASVQLVFAGTSYIFPVFGGYVADSVAGRYNTILGSCLLYVLGLFLLGVCPVDFTAVFGEEYSLGLGSTRGYFFLGLALISIGTGGIKANVGPFGAQQVEVYGSLAVQTFFNWFYWFINIGGLIAYTAVAYVQQSVSFVWGYWIPFFSMFVALVIFVSCRGRYVHSPPGESVLLTIIKVCYEGCSCTKPVDKTQPVFARARMKYGGSFQDAAVDGVVSVLRVLPIFALLLGYAAVYAQMQSTFFLQSERMSVRVGSGEIPVAMLNSFNTIIILILIPVVDRCLYPLLNRHGFKLSHLKRMGIGLLFSASSVVVAGIVEIFRKEDLRNTGGIIQVLAQESFNASSLSVLAQVPQFALVGSAEVFTSISGLEFAFTQAPPYMQGFLTGLFYVVLGLGNYLASLLLVIVNAASSSDPWFPDELNNGHGEYLFFLLAGIILANLGLFIVVARRYKYSQTQKHTTIVSGPESDETKPMLARTESSNYGSSQTQL